MQFIHAPRAELDVHQKTLSVWISVCDGKTKHQQAVAKNEHELRLCPGWFSEED